MISCQRCHHASHRLSRPLGRGTTARLVCLFLNDQPTVGRARLASSTATVRARSAGPALWRATVGPNFVWRGGGVQWRTVDTLLFGTPTVLSAQLLKLFDVAHVHQLKSDGVLFAAGDAGDGCYRLDKGLLKVMVTSTGGEERIVAILGPGAVVGELSMFDRMSRSASVVALRDSVLRFVSRETYEKYVLSHPEIKQALLKILAFRLRRTDEELVAATFLGARGPRAA